MLQGVKESYRGLINFTGGDSGLQGLQGVSVGYIVLLGVTGG